jgi:adenosine/AMP kinase
MYSLAFNELRVKRLFRFNGNDYQKNSSRTARMLSNGRIFYIGQTDIVHPIAW